MSDHLTIDDFHRSLSSFIDSGKLPREALGDLDDLLMTAESLCHLLREIGAAGEQDGQQAKRKMLFRLQILIEQDLPLIFNDLVPVLRQLTGENMVLPKNRPAKRAGPAPSPT
jgi:hypothetical protein